MFEAKKIEQAIHDCEFRLKIIQVRIDRGYGNKETEQMKENVLLEIEALRALEKSMRIKDILGNDYDLDRLRELVQADREGRCVVLPCKPSNVTVYQLRSKKHARGRGVSPCHVGCAVVWAGGHYALEHQGDEPCWDRDFGKTWFLTPEAAEKALEEMEENENG